MELINRLQKRILNIILALIILSQLLISPLSAAPFEPNQRSLRIGVELNAPPYSFVDDNGMLKGFNVDLVRAIAIEMGIDIELYAQTSTDLYNNLLNNGLDAIISDQGPGSGLIASSPLIESQDAIFVLADNQYISDLDGFWNNPVAINSQSLTTLISSYLDKHNAVSPKIVMDQEHGFLLLMNHEVDSYIGDKASGIFLIQKWNQEDYIKLVGVPFNISSYVFISNAADKSLVSQLNNSLATVLNDQSYEKIYEKWFGESAASYEKKVRRYFYISGGAGLLALLIMVFSLKLRSILKKEVERRTHELNQANEALLLQQNHLKDKDQFKEDILNSVTTGIITFNEKGQVTSVNAKAMQSLDIQSFSSECPPEALPGLSFIDRQKLMNVLECGTFHTDLEGEITIQGESKILEYQIYPLRNRQGESSGAIVNFEDTSKERRLDEEMIKMDKMKSLDLLVSEFVHEIRTPLTSIKTMVELLPSKVENLEFRRNMLEIVTMEVQRLDKLVTTLSEYAKPTTNNRLTFEIGTVLDGVLFLLQRKLNEKAVAVNSRIKPGLIVAGDPMQLMQVFINIILNSIEAMAPHGRISIEAYSQNDSVCINIKDNGPGIPEEYLPKITEPFFTMRQNGTGLGLYICSKLIKEHQGTLSIQSQAGEGTAISISLPKAQQRFSNGE